MEKVLYLQNKHWDKPYEGLMPRALLPWLIKKISLKEIQVLLGIRRAGKSTLFQLIINHLLKTEPAGAIVYLNLDDPFYAEVWEDPKVLYDVLETAEKLTGQKPTYLFLDEIQNVTGWERFVKSVYDSQCYKKIFVTGSNSRLLNTDYTKLLTGRHTVDYVHPLGFSEILHAHNIHSALDIQKHKAKVLTLAESMLFYGGFPEVHQTKEVDLKREQLISYYDSIVLKDCIDNHRIRDIKTLKDLSLYLISNNGTLYSYNSLAKKIQSNENTTKEFIHVLESSFLINEIKQFHWKLGAQNRQKKKSYCIDNGFLQVIATKFSSNTGKLFENLVYSELIKSGCEDVYYFNHNKECDFILKRDNKLLAIQVTYKLDADNSEREMQGLQAAMQELNITQGYIVTFNQEQKATKGVTILPFWKFVFELSDKH